ncbi:hypothetical protein H6503_04170 [Candidatus Woesearchaeota archaeon]|nr:hypothetical protein [Candidatus Woesearchaeota archaeon]
MATLYDQLVFFENFNNTQWFKVTEHIKEIDKALAELEIRSPMVRRIGSLHAPGLFDYHEIDAAKYQDELIESWSRSNFILSEIINKRINGIDEGLEYRINILAHDNKGKDRFLPRGRDADLNHEIAEMEKLVGDMSYLKHNGIWYPDNPLTAFVEFAIGAYAVCSLPGFIFPALASKLGISGGSAAITSSLFGIRPSNSELPLDKARYIDEKVFKYSDNLEPGN